MWKKQKNQTIKDEDDSKPDDSKTSFSLTKKILIPLIILLFIISINLILHSNLLSETIHPIIASQLEKIFGEGVTIGKVSLNLLPTYIEIKDFSLKGAANNRFLSVKKARIYFSPLSLITEVFLIRKISLSEPAIEILDYRKEDRIKDLIRPKSTDSGGSRNRLIVIRRIDIKDGGGRIKAKDNRMEAHVMGLNAEIEPDLTMQNYLISITIKEVALNISGISRRLAQVEGKAALHPDNLEIKKFEVGSGNLLFSLMGTISGFEKPRFNLEARSATGLDGIDRLYQPLEGIGGRLEIIGEIKGKYPDVAWKGQLYLKELSFKSLRLGELNSDISLSKDQIILSNASADMFGGHLAGGATGSISLVEGLRYRLQLNFEEIKMEEVKILLPEEFPVLGKIISGKVSFGGIGLNKKSLDGEGEIRIHGKPDTPKDKINSSWKEILVSLPDEIDLTFKVMDGDIDIRTLRISSAGSKMEMNGSVYRSGDIELSVRLSIRDVKDILEGSGFADIAGGLELAGKLSGNMTSPLFHGEIKMKDAVLEGVRIDRFSSGIDLTDKDLSFLNAMVKTGVSSYKFQGRIAWKDDTKNPHIDLRVRIINGSPSEIARIFHKEIQINTPVTGKMSIKGDIKELNLLAILSIKRGEIFGQSIDSGKADLAINNSGVTISNIILAREKSIFKGTGWIGFNGGFKSTIKSNNLELQDLDMITSRIPNLKGKVSFELSGNGTFSKPILLGGISVNKLSYSGYDIGDARIDVWTATNSLDIKAYVSDRLTASGKIGLKDSLPITADIKLTEMPVGIFLDLFHPDLPSKVSITTSGKVSINGNLTDPKSIHADIRLPNLTMDISGYQMRNENDISVELKGEEIKVVSLMFRGDDTSLTIKGGLKTQNNLDIFIEGEADLGLLKLFTRDISLSKGKTVFALTISDKWRDPKIRGNLKVLSGIVRSEIVSTQSINITAMNLLFNEHQILIEKFEGLAGNGNMHGSGKIDIKNMSVSSVEIILEFKDVRHALISDFHSVIDGTLIFQANNRLRRLTGDINIKKGKYEKRVDINRWLIEVRKITSAQRPAKVSNDISLNIHFYGKDNIWINNNITKVPLELDLYLKGSVNRPVLLGRIEANDGSVFFRGNEFKVISGTVDFLDLNATKPQFDIKINTKVRTYKIDTNLAGTLDRFDLRLSSNPPLSETDILALLTVGRTSAEFTQTQKDIGKEAAASLLVEEFIEEKVQDLTGIDRFQVDPYYSGVKSSSGPRFTVGKKLLDDRMYVIYASTLDPSVEELIQIEYKLAKNISLIGSRDEKGLLGGDIRFRFEFK